MPASINANPKHHVARNYYADEGVVDLCKRAERWKPAAVELVAEVLLENCPVGATLYPYQANSGNPRAAVEIAQKMASLRDDLKVSNLDSALADHAAYPVFVTLHIDDSQEPRDLRKKFPHALFLTYSQRDRAPYLAARSILSNRELVTQENVDDALFALFDKQDSDAVLFEGIKLLFEHSIVTRNLTKSTLSDTTGFFMDSPHATLAKIMKEIDNDVKQLNLKKSIIDDRQSNLIGLQMFNRSGDQAIVFLPDASEPGRYRVSYFDKGGFFSHLTRDTYSELLDIVWQEGFRPDPNMPNPLEDWAVSSKWGKGSEVTAAIQQVNLGNMSHDAYLGVVQWHAHGEKVLELSQAAISQSLEPGQRRLIIQEQCREVLGLSLSKEALDELSVNPEKRPVLNGRLFEPVDHKPPVADEDRHAPRLVNRR